MTPDTALPAPRRPPTYPEGSTPIPTRSPRAADDEWRDAQGTPITPITPITLRARVEQIAIDPAHGALPSLLHQQGWVIGWGAGLVYVIFEQARQTATLPSHLLRMLPRTPSGE